MVITSEAYREEQKQELREKSYVYVYMGIFNQIAAEKAQISSDLTDYSDNGDNINYVFRTHNIDNTYAQYATLEDDFTKVNGTNAFLPRESYLYDHHQGLVTLSPVSKIKITFPGAVNVDIKGLTIDFGEIYPTSFTISNGNVIYSYNNSDSLFSCEDQFDDCSYLEITPISMVGGQQRLRIKYMEFGVGLSFSNEELISTQRRNSISHLSSVLPLKAFDFTISNLSRRFSQDNPFSFSNYIQQGQKVTFEYGRELLDAWGDVEEVYKIPGGVTYLKTWSSTDSQSKFSTVGRLDFMDSDFYKSGFYGHAKIYQENGDLFERDYNITASELAEIILQDAGLTSDEYYISPYLDNVVIENPIPPATHKACLQMIANLTKSILYEDRSGKICLSSSFVPAGSDAEFLSESNIYQADTEVFDKNALKTYSTLEDNFTRVDNTMYFLPRYYEWDPETYTPMGIITNVGGGTIKFGWDYAWSFYNMRIRLAEVLPDALIITFYDSDGNTIKEIWYEDEEVTSEIEINGYFENVASVEIVMDIDSKYEDYAFADEFDDVLVDESENILGYRYEIMQRCHIKSIIFDRISNYEITNMDLRDKPTATSIDLVKNITANYYKFVPNNDHWTDIKQITTLEVKPGLNTIRVANPIFTVWSGFLNCRVLWEDNSLQEWSESKSYAVGETCKYKGYKYSCLRANTGIRPECTSEEYMPSNPYWHYIPVEGVSISSVGCYYVDVNVTSIPNNTNKLVLYARPIDISYKTIVRQLHDIGNDIKLSNQLVSTEERANDLIDFIEEESNVDTEYTIQYRGEPALDCDDLVYLENQFVNDNLCRIEEEELSTGIGMNLQNNMKLRRLSYSLK